MAMLYLIKMKIEMPNWDEVAKHYDGKGEDDLNYLVALDKRIVHHHSGIIDKDTLKNRNLNTKNIYKLLGISETKLTLFGGENLNLPPSKGLDCGCGRGGSTFILAKIFGHHMHGINITNSQLMIAKQSAKKLGLEDTTSFEKINIYDMENKKNCYDFIWACESTEYLPNLNSLFDIWHKLLYNKGKIILFALTYKESMKKSICEELKKINEIYVTSISSLENYFFYLRKNGFNLKKMIPLEKKVIPYWELRNKLPNKRGTEEHIIKGLKSGALQYSMMLLQKN